MKRGHARYFKFGKDLLLLAGGHNQRQAMRLVVLHQQRTTRRAGLTRTTIRPRSVSASRLG